MRKAFTLIELLVVIAILAAILFPVFAQAKEAGKKTATLSNVKQLATGMIMYSSDADDNLPSAYAIDDGAGCYGMGAGEIAWDSGWGTTLPLGADYPSCVGADGQQWIHSTNPYRKSLALDEVVGGRYGTGTTRISSMRSSRSRRTGR